MTAYLTILDQQYKTVSEHKILSDKDKIFWITEFTKTRVSMYLLGR